LDAATGSRAEGATSDLATSFRACLEQRIAAALEWYAHCDACEETVANVRRDLDAVLRATCAKFRIRELPFLLRVRLEGNEIVVTTVSRDLS
jgi:hypothetical protein